ncbi:MAG: tetratricopeptide repeat protein [Gammaproteobacteria bacterium]|nr:MAG: tetratricopeptide repeat protein [Gammaproteobacteria bacterium]
MSPTNTTGKTRTILKSISVISVLVIVGVVVFAKQQSATQDGYNTYQDELARIQNNIHKTDPDDPKYAYQHIQLAQLTGDFADFKKADLLLERFPQDRELALLHAKISLNMHDVERGAAYHHDLSSHFHDSRTQELELDIALQKGQYDEAIHLLKTRLNPDAEWSDLARYAYLIHKFGDSNAADKIFTAAQESLSTKELKDYAWLELQRGIIDLEDEKYSDALAHFESANEIYPGHWLIEEHLAETYGFLNQPQKAIKLYERVVKHSDNPMYFFALADLLEEQQPERASQLKKIAEEKFNQRYKYYPLAASGHLIDAWIEEQQNQPNSKTLDRLLELSAMNLKYRPNADAQIQRIKVLILAGQSEEAKKLTETLLATPWRTPDVLHLAKTFNLSVPAQRSEFLPDAVINNEVFAVR